MDNWLWKGLLSNWKILFVNPTRKSKLIFWNFFNQDSFFHAISFPEGCGYQEEIIFIKNESKLISIFKAGKIWRQNHPWHRKYLSIGKVKDVRNLMWNRWLLKVYLEMGNSHDWAALVNVTKWIWIINAVIVWRALWGNIERRAI